MGSRRAPERVCTVIELLDREWAILAQSKEAATALAGWGRGDEVLTRFATMAELVAYVECRSVDVVARDEVLGRVGTRAGSDEMAARTLLQLLLPGAKALVARYAWSAESVDEVAAAVVADVYDRIRALPAAAPRRCLAPAVLSEARKRLQRRAARARHDTSLEELGAEGAPSYEPERAAAEELDELLRWAVDRGHLNEAEAELICLTRVRDVPVSLLSAHTGECPQTIRQRRLRAERALRDAVAVA
ncbi:MAG: hypothetical protein ABR540_18995 [Acidimicrobiales bacterium]